MLNPFARGARRFLFSCLVAVALLVVADRAGLWAAQHDVAKRLQADAHLHATPKVEIHGFPFLTQLIGGDYHDVDIRMSGLDSNSLRIDKLTVHLHDAHVSIGDVLSQDRSRIRVDQAAATLTLTWPDLEAAIRRSVGDVATRRFAEQAVTGVSVSGANTLLLHSTFGNLPLEIRGLPFGIRLTSAKTTRSGVEVTGRAEGLTLRP